MIYQSDLNIELQFLFYVVANVIAYEVFFYIIYKVIKVRKLKLLTHNILLPLGLLLLFETIISTLLEHSKFGLTDPPKIQILHLIALYLVIVIIILFVSFISFNIILISPIIRKIKLRLVPIIISQILIIFSLYLDVFTLINVISTIFLLLGNLSIFIIISSGFLINAFLNIKGSETLRGLYIINSIDHKCLYHYDFTKKDQLDNNRNDLSYNSEQNLEDVFFSHGIEGIENIISSITNTQEERIQFISQGGFLLILEYGSKYNIPLTYVLIADKEQKHMKFLLNMLKNQFESTYKEILRKFDTLRGNQTLVFNSFDTVINNIID
ncbi:MAG: hypothetical protein ACFFBP_18520 [Promethearchaeota archaeon]